MTALMKEPEIVEMPGEHVSHVVDALPSDVRMLATLHPLVVAGGFIRCVADGSRARDVDVFCPSLYVTWAAASMLALARGTRPDCRAPGGRVLRLSGSDLGYFVSHIEGCPPVQIIHPPDREHPWGRSRTGTLLRAVLPTGSVAMDWVDGPLVSAFDLTMTAAAVWFDPQDGRWCGRQHPGFADDVRERRLVPLSTHTPASTLRRVADFIHRGWQVTPAMAEALLHGLLSDASKEQWKVLTFVQASVQASVADPAPPLPVAVSPQIRASRARRLVVREATMPADDDVPLVAVSSEELAHGGRQIVASGVDFGMLILSKAWWVLAGWMEFVRPLIDSAPVSVAGADAEEFGRQAPLDAWDDLVNRFRSGGWRAGWPPWSQSELTTSGGWNAVLGVWNSVAEHVPAVQAILSAVGRVLEYGENRQGNYEGVLAEQTRAAGLLWGMWVTSAPQWPLRVLTTASREHGDQWEEKAGGLTVALRLEAELAPVAAWLARQRDAGERLFRAMVWREVRRTLACRLSADEPGV